MYMMPLAMGLSCSARVSFWRGAGDENRARAALVTGLGITSALAAMVAAAGWLLRLEIAQLYTSNPELATITAALLAWVALYHPADAIQAMSIFALRSYRITVAPLLVYTVLLWGIGLGGGYLLCYQGLPGVAAMHSPAAFWIAGAFGLILTACVFVALLWWALNQVEALTTCGAVKSRWRDSETSVKRDPTPIVLSILSSAPWRCATCLTMAKPSPVPPVSRDRLRSTR